MAQVILITGGRGGCGKSTVCAFLGETLAALGKSVLLLEGSHRSLDVLFGVSDSVLFDLADAVEQHCELSDAMLPVGAAGRMGLLCAPLGEGFQMDPPVCRELMQTLDTHFDYILVELDGQSPAAIAAYAPAANRAVIVATADRTSVRACRAVSDALDAAGVADIRLCVNMLSHDFLRLRPIPDIDWMIDQVCAQLICILPFDETLMTVTTVQQCLLLSPPVQRIFENFAQRIMGNYIDLLVQ